MTAASLPRHADREQITYRRRHLAGCALVAAGFLGGAAWAGHSTADALSTGGAKVQCVTVAHYYPQYHLVSVVSTCGSYGHRGGWF